MDPIIKTEDLSVIYNLGKSNEVVALRDANIEIYPEEYIIFFGPSGCGKSTLLYSLIGIESPTEGKIEVMGRDVSKLNQKQIIELRRNGTGMIFQSFNLIPTLSVLNNITLPKIFGGENPSQRKKRAIYLCKVFGIENLMHRFPGELSGGQQQRVAIARSLVYSPLIIMADEPVGNLDSQSAEIAMKILDDLNQKQKKTVVLVTHNPQHLHHANRIFYMKDGKIIREVVNSEKSQIIKREKKQKGISVQLEKLARTFPTLSWRKLQTKSLTNYIIQDLSMDRVERLEEVVNKLILGKISEEDFQKTLDKPFRDGGIGLYKQTAEKYRAKVAVILKEARLLRKRIQEEEVSDRAERETENSAMSLRAFLLDKYNGKITLRQVKKLDKAIEGRLLSALNKDQFERFLDTPLDQGGVGLNKTTARKFARRLEIVLAQTVQK